MKLNNTVITLALMGVLALAALAGGLLPIGNQVHAADPRFDSDTSSRNVLENTRPGVNIGTPISATDADDDGADNDDIEFGDTLTYSLSGTDAASFDIDASTGQLITKAPLDFESPSGGAAGNTNAYAVTVTVKDTMGGSVEQGVTINVTDDAEAPGALAAPTVVSGPDTDTTTDPEESTTSLKVIWNPPADAGDGVVDYDVDYKKSTEPTFTTIANITDTTTTITGLDADTSYHVRVRATNGVGNGPWSLSRAGSTNKEGNIPPNFNETSVARTMLETAEAGLVVGSPVSATDTDNVIPLAYRLDGPDAGMFDFRPTSGQILTKRGVTYDHEGKPTLNVTVTVFDGQGGSDARAVAIAVNDVAEAPATPARPTVRATASNSRSLEVSWTEPENMGPAITGYDLRYREAGGGAFRTQSTTGTGTTATIMPEDNTGTTEIDERLTPGTSYEVSVRAKTAEIDSQWSAAGTGRTNPGNNEPKFSNKPGTEDRDPNGTGTFSTPRSVAENTRPGQPVGSAVGAADRDGDTRTYTLVTAGAPNADDFNKFDINESTGQLLTKAPLNHEADDCNYISTDDPTTCTYMVKVQVSDGRDEHGNDQGDAPTNDDTIIVEIRVTDRLEPPTAPTVTVTSPSVGSNEATATLQVAWDAPANTGLPTTGYRLECSGHQVPDDQCPQDLVSTATSPLTIIGLTPGRSYTVRLRAINAEGAGAWSSSVSQSTSKAGNNSPTLTEPTGLSVQENAPSARTPIGSPVTSGDVDSETVTYRLEGSHTNLFDIDSRTGQIRTKRQLNYEDAECNPDGTGCTYTVRVKASDPSGGSATVAGTITVTDEDEPPSAPAAPRVAATAGSGWSLEVTWNEPRNTGPAITDYDIRYREYKASGTANPWRDWPHATNGGGNTDRSAKITTILDDTNTAVHLTPGTEYEVQIRAKNGEPTGDTTVNWSSSGRGRTNPSNTRPAFVDPDALVTLEVDENTRSGQNIGSAVEATDADRNSLRYSLEGPNKNLFSIVAGGQIKTRAALNYEAQASYSLTVKVDDGSRKANSSAVKSVTVNLRDVEESPSASAAPRVAGIPGSTSSVRVTWDEPANAGPPITRYDVQYKESSRPDDAYGPPDHAVPDGNADRSTVITGLTAGTRYSVRVRAWNDEGSSDWSRPGTGSPNPDVENRNPAFSSRALTFSVPENSPSNTDVGSVVAATDPDGDVLNYTLEGPDAPSFDIVATGGGGQIRTSADLNFEDKARYSVAVRVRDGRGGTDAVNVTINVTDVDTEAPDTPFAPTVAAVSSTSILVTWDAPDTTGPPITDYDYRYMSPSDTTWTEVTNTAITATTVTIDGLTPSTSYDVEVRAKNAEGTSGWSNSGNGATNAPGANNPPVFTEGTSATRSVSATSPSGTNIGEPVAATDADSGDTLTYTLEGRDAPSFDIGETNGQLRTKSGITLIVGTTYTVTVAADDGKDITRITVSIEATAAPPNNPPVFTGANTTRSVASSAAAGTAVGQPVTATDADAGDTLTYSLEGTDAASFDIVSTSGQIRTLAGVTLSQSSYTVVVVASDGKSEGRITVTITVIPNIAPRFNEGVGTTRTVASSDPAGTAIGLPVTATDADAGDTLTYSLEGTDAASFNIDSTNGQLRTKSGITLNRSSYEVEVVASDGSASARITVRISVTLNVAPEFASSSTTRSVVEQGPVGSNVGAPVTATDADAGDTLTYSLGGADAATFSIVAASGQIRSAIMLDEETRTSYTVTVTANDGTADSDPITVNITVTDVTYGCATRGAVTSSNSGLARDCEALLESRDKLEDGGARLNWSVGRPIADWDGIRSDSLEGGRVTKLYLHRLSLGGVIAPELGDVSELKWLYLHRNELTGEIPGALGNLVYLEQLRLDGNRLSGEVPGDLNRLSSLVWLYVHNNQLTSISDDLGAGMAQLKRIFAQGNRIRSIPTGLDDMPRLDWLRLDRNNLTGSIPSWIGNLTMLRRLYLHEQEGWNARGGLTGSIPTSLRNLDRLEYLVLNRNSLSGPIPTEVALLSNLKWLGLYDNSLSGQIPSQLGGLFNLERLYLHGNELSGTVPGSLASLGSLTNLWLRDNQLTGQVPEALGNLPNLERVRISGNSFSGCIPEGLQDGTGRTSDAEDLNLPTCTN